MVRALIRFFGGAMRPAGCSAILYLGLASVLAAEEVDASFKPDADSHVYSLVAQPDGRLLVGGAFTQLGGQARRYLGRLRTDGTLDVSFAPDLNGVVQEVLLQADGRILLCGQFTSVNGQARNRFARLNSDGTIDGTFNPGAGANATVYHLLRQPDGKILLAGVFDRVGGRVRNGIARIQPDGSLDEAFDPSVTEVFIPGATPGVVALALQPDGRIVIVGQFLFVGGQARNGVARINADGSLDATFAPSRVAASYSAVVVQADGRILVGGGFSQIAGTAQRHLARLNPDGSLDASFAPSLDGGIAQIFPTPDGRLLISGYFERVGGQPRRQFARLTGFGALDASFSLDVVNAEPFVFAPVAAVVYGQDGSITLGGNFQALAGVARGHLARLQPGLPGRLINLAVRGTVPANGDLVLGFVIRGGPKPLLVRAVGPTLTGFGVNGAIADPRLEVVFSATGGVTNTNDNWGGGSALAALFVATGAFALPTGSADAAIALTLPADSHGVRVTSAVPGGTGIALAEVYDREAVTSASRLANVSVLGVLGTGAQALIPGFVIGGSGTKRVLIRAVGPGLAPFGVNDGVVDPQIAVVAADGGVTLATNDNWGNDPALLESFTLAGAFALPTGSKDAAVVLRLPPGGYAVTVAGGTGRVLLEIYDLDP